MRVGREERKREGRKKRKKKSVGEGQRGLEYKLLMVGLQGGGGIEDFRVSLQPQLSSCKRGQEPSRKSAAFEREGGGDAGGSKGAR